MNFARVLMGVACTVALSAALMGLGIGAAGPRPATAGVAETFMMTPPPPTIPERNTVPDGGRAQGAAAEDFITPWDLPAGSLYLNPVSGRKEVIDPAVSGQAVLFGDSQSGGAWGVKPADTWVQKGLRDRGYSVRFEGAGGTGFVAERPGAPNYVDSLESGKVTLPFGKPALVVLQGGGNDAGSGATDEQILGNVDRLVRELRRSYPESPLLIIGTLAVGGKEGGRRTQVDALLGGFAHSNGVLFISAGDWLGRYKIANKLADRVHLTAAGHNALAPVLADHLKALELAGPELKR